MKVGDIVKWGKTLYELIEYDSDRCRVISMVSNYDGNWRNRIDFYNVITANLKLATPIEIAKWRKKNESR